MAPTPFGLEATRPFFSPSTAGLSAALASPHVVALCPRNPAIALLRQLASLFCPRFPSIAQLRKTTRARSSQTVPCQQLNLINLLLQRVQYEPTRAFNRLPRPKPMPLERNRPDSWTNLQYVAPPLRNRPDSWTDIRGRRHASTAQLARPGKDRGAPQLHWESVRFPDRHQGTAPRRHDSTRPPRQ